MMIVKRHGKKYEVPDCNCFAYANNQDGHAPDCAYQYAVDTIEQTDDES